MRYYWYMGFAAHTLRSARQRAGLTQRTLADRAGTSQATISAYESGAKEPTVATFSRLLAATGMVLQIEPARAAIIEPSAAQLAEAARGLAEVIAFAETFPVRHEPTLRYPRLPAPA
jgi:transcriptional regulator with XRE-family HTH domain